MELIYLKTEIPKEKVFNKMRHKIQLTNWKILPVNMSDYSGTEISQGINHKHNSIETKVPSTLLGAMVASGMLPDPREGSHYNELPGIPEMEVLDNFALREMPENSPFTRPRWWIASFSVFSDEQQQYRKNCILEINGINYCGEAWVNGHLVSDSENMAGTYRNFSFDISGMIQEKNNILALKIYPPESDSLAFSFVDWHPMPPDKCTGLWRNVNLDWFDDICINDIFVQNSFKENYSIADVTINLELYNAGSKPLSVTYEIDCRYFNISGRTVIRSGLNTLIADSSEYPELLIDSPVLWWPYQFGDPELVDITVSVRADSFEYDSLTISHGFREISSYLNSSGDRQFSVNGVDILIRGGAWAPDMLLGESDIKDKIDVAYLEDMGLNTIRFEGNFGSDNLWELCDQEGILIIAGWTCDSFWEEYNSWTDRTKIIADESFKSLLRRFRNHASLAAWFYGSDLLAPPDIERMYLKTLKNEAPDLIAVASAGKYNSAVSGGTGVKMSGPYSYVPPVYWYLNNMPGFASGFNTETGPDASIPPIESLERMFPDKQVKVGSPSWVLHTGLRQFRGTTVTETAIAKRYGSSHSMYEMSKKSQVISYESWRAMFEAAARNRGKCTGIIGWMLTNSWPSLIWHLYDYNLYPTGGYYGTKKACSPYHVILDYSNNSLHSVNNTLKDLDGINVDVELLSINEYGKCELIWSDIFSLNIPANSSQEIGCLPDLSGSQSIYFLFILLESNNMALDRNIYWLSDEPDDMTDKHVQFGTTEVAHFSDFSGLDKLPSIKLDVECKSEIFNLYTFSLYNNSRILGFFIELKIIVEGGFQVLPVLWSDNYITIRPGEKVNISCRLLFPVEDNANLAGEITGYNVNRTTVGLKDNDNALT